jgi:hypothetical protein
MSLCPDGKPNLEAVPSEELALYQTGEKTLVEYPQGLGAIALGPDGVYKCLHPSGNMLYEKAKEAMGAEVATADAAQAKKRSQDESTV